MIEPKMLIDDMLRHFRESNKIEGFNSKAADACLVTAWDYLSRQQSLSKQVICTVQLLVTYHQRDLTVQQRGAYRTVGAFVGNDEAPHPVAIENLMNDFIYMSNWKEKSPKELHVRFEKIHPFVDGNGRTGRLLMWWQEVQEGKLPTLIRYDDRKDYYEWFR